jgi:hypothetical protein
MTWPELTAEIARRARAARIDDEFIRAFEEGYDSAERRKQALKERIRRMDEERRAKYVAT